MELQRTLEILNRAQENNQIVCLYSSLYYDKFTAGWIEALSDSAVVLRSLHPTGRANGWSLKVLSEIARIDVAGRYEERLGYLAQMREARWKDGFLSSIAPDADLMWEMFVASQRHDFVVGVDIGAEEDIQGVVQDVTPQWVTIDKISFDGLFDGQGTVATEDIKGILVDEQSLQDLQVLARRHGRGSGEWK